MSGSEQDTLTAYHEAGHAVIALMLGRAVHEVSILPGGKRLGYCEMRKGGRAPKDALEADLLILLAGMAAEAKISGQYGLDGASQDLQMAERLALSRAGNARQAQRLMERTLESGAPDERHRHVVGDRPDRRRTAEIALSERSRGKALPRSGEGACEKIRPMGRIGPIGLMKSICRPLSQ